MTEIKLIYTQFREPIPEKLYNYYLEWLPEDLRIKNGRYRRWQDRHNHLFGKVLLVCLAAELGVDQVLDRLSYTKYDRPFLQDSMDFNISHTGTAVACAITRDARIGLDIEEYSQVDFSDFGRIHSEAQWNQINASPDPQKAFFEFWTIKESVIKVNGKGLSIPLEGIMINQDTACQGDHKWYLKRLDLEEEMAACIACDQPDFNLQIVKITEEQVYARSICRPSKVKY